MLHLYITIVQLIVIQHIQVPSEINEYATSWRYKDVHEALHTNLTIEMPPVGETRMVYDIHD